MRRRPIRSLRLAAALLLLAGFAAPAHAQSLTGTWSGALEVGATRLRIVFHLERSGDDGALHATLDSPDQGVTGLPVAGATFEDGVLRLDVAIAGGKYEGTLAEGGDLFEGDWTQSGRTFPLTLKRAAEGEETTAGPARPQEPKPPFPYHVETITFENRDAGVTLAGTLTRPEEGGPHPAVILLSGSGPQDRDETIFNHRPFLLLADALTRAGVAVLRYDERGVGESTGDFTVCTTRDFASDARAALAWMRARGDIDGARVGFLGHSEGGLVAPLVARDTGHVAFMVLLGAPAVPGDETLIRQGELLNGADGQTPEAVARNREAQRRLFELAKGPLEGEALKVELRRILEETIEEMSPAEREALGDKATFIHSQTEQIASPWLRFFLAYDPRPALEALRCPVLALFGGKDLQVSAPENLSAMGEALEAGGNTDHTLRVMPGLNHLFQHAETGLVHEYAAIEETMAPEVLETITEWIVEKTKP